MVKHAQLLLRDLDGHTRVLAFDRVPSVSCAEVVTAAAAALGLPRDAVRLVAGTALLHSRSAADQLLVAHDGALPACTLVLPLAGGKGGFGSLLRGAGKGGRILANDDACRDLSGRRLRDVNAEKKLKEWAASAKDRELEKLAEKHVRAQAHAAARAGDTERGAVEAFQREQAALLGQLSTAVRSGLGQAEAAAVAAKRKAVQQAEAVPAKKACFWTLASETGEEPLSEDDDEPQQQEREEAPAPAPEPQAADAPEGVAEGAAAEEEAAAVDLAQYQSAAELEALGLDALKRELTARGLKCGGTLGERASRLFLLSRTPFEELEAKHKAAPPKGSRR